MLSIDFTYFSRHILSPVLAAGQGAGTGGTIPISGAQSQAPQLSLDTMFVMNLMKMEADISATRAQEEYTKLQQQRAEQLLPAELAQIEAGIKNTDANTYRTYQEGKKVKVDAQNAEKQGFVPKSTAGAIISDFGNANVNQIIRNMYEKARGTTIPTKSTPLTKKEILELQKKGVSNF